jgi:hypothetical protein
MLSDYGIENAATKIDDKENDLFNIELPFIAHTGSDFAVVQKIEADNVRYFWNDKTINIPIWQFIQTWSGIVLLAETSPNSIEPNSGAYSAGLKSDWDILRLMSYCCYSFHKRFH